MKLDPAYLGARLRALRTARALGLRKVALAAGCSPGYLSRVELGEEVSPPSEQLLRNLARVLDGDPDELLLLAGRVPADVLREVLRGGPALWAELRRRA